jgi:hypothetical protein
MQPTDTTTVVHKNPDSCNSYDDFLVHEFTHGNDFVDKFVEHGVYEWKRQYVHAAQLRSLTHKYVTARKAPSESDGLLSVTKVEQELLDTIEAEASRVEEFYATELANMQLRIDDLFQRGLDTATLALASCKELNATSGESRGHAWDEASRVAHETHEIRKSYARELNSCKTLIDFCIVNRGALSQVIGDCFNLAGITELDERLQRLRFWKHEEVPELRRAFVSGYAKNLCDGNESFAEAQLHIENIQGDPHVIVAETFHAGITWGIAIALISWTWYEVVSIRATEKYPFQPHCLAHFGVADDDQRRVLSLARDYYNPMYVSMSTFILWCVCWCALLKIWPRLGINHHAILGFNPVNSKTAQDVSRCAAVLISIWSVSFLLNKKAVNCRNGLNEWPMVVGLNPILMYIFSGIYVAYFSRGVILTFFASAVASPFVAAGVSTMDGYFGDVLTSLIKPIHGAAYTACFFFTGEFTLRLGDQGACHKEWYGWGDMPSIAAIVLLLFPNILRMAQNLRLFYNSGAHHPNLSNTCKYAVGTLVSLFGFVHIIPAFETRSWYYWCWMALFVGASVYAFLWDIIMDWNLFSCQKHECCALSCSWCHLRNRRLLGSAWIYYSAMVADFFGRFFFTYTLIPSGKMLFISEYAYWFGMLAPVLEILRRALWSVIKLEFLHLKVMLSNTPPPPPRPTDSEVQKSAFFRNMKVILEILGFVIMMVLLTAMTVMTADRPRD